MVVSSSPINKFQRPSNVVLLYSINDLLNDTYVLESFLSVTHLVANLVKNVDERGRNIMCERTFPSLLVYIVLLLKISTKLKGDLTTFDYSTNIVVCQNV